MNSSTKGLAKNLLYSVSANFISMFVSIVSILFFPKLLGVENYGYYQLYLFYISFAGLFHFGIVDGVALKFAGNEYSSLRKQRLGEQYWFLFIVEIIMLIMVFFFSNLIDIEEFSKLRVIIFSALSILLTNLRSYILSILQSSNRIIDYSKLTRIDRIMFIIPALLYLVCFGKNFEVLLLIDLVCRAIALLYGMSLISVILFKVEIPKIKDLKNTIELVCIGINLTLSFVASQLIIGIIRFGIEKKWSIVEFGKISLTLSLSNMFITFINAVGATLFPYLRRVDNKSLSKIYGHIRIFLMFFSFGLLLFYYPLSSMLLRWLPNYSDSIRYMGILFPIFIYESKTSLLTNTFLKTIRGEKTIFFSNVLTLILSMALSVISIFVLKSITYAVFSILILLIFRSDLSEFYLVRKLSVSNGKSRFLELIVTLIFVLGNTNLMMPFSFLVYSAAYAVLVCYNKNSILNFVIFLKKALRRKR